jgi:Uma2 family endonuclease
MKAATPTMEKPRRKPKMAAPKLQPRYTVDEYLEMERAAEDRHEYLDGVIIAMAGESLAHGDISVNVVVSLASQLKGKPCRALTKDMKVRSGPIPEKGQSRKGLFSYPDVLVICDEPEYHDAHKDVILNPKVIIEVLSESTEAFVRGKKFERYQKYNPTFKDYVLISQDRPQIEHFQRKTDGEWSYRIYSGLKTKVVITNIRCTLKMSEVYDRVKFPED